jgi:O-antigen/teichoic acid export membrane protein
MLRSNESAISGILLGYIASIINYSLAVLYVIVLTRFISLEDYGYYNALLSIAGIISMFFPTLGIDWAIVREGAVKYGEGKDPLEHYSALFLISISITMAYIITLIIITPLYITSVIPERFIGIIYLYILYVIVSAFVNILSSYLWMIGRFATQSLGTLIGGMIFRISEIILIIMFKTVYVIITTMLIGQIFTALFYFYNVRKIPVLRQGIHILRNNFGKYFSTGIQVWILSYLGTISANMSIYLIYMFLGPSYTGLYTTANNMIGAVTALTGSVINVFRSRLAHVYGSGGEVKNLLRDYVRATVFVTSLLSASAIAALPALPLIGIVVGDYVKAIPYGVALISLSTASSLSSLYINYLWVLERGWHALDIGVKSLAGYLVSLVILLTYAGSLGLYTVVIAGFIGSMIGLMIIFRELRASEIALETILLWIPSIASAYIYVSKSILWPIPQIIMMLAPVVTGLLRKPLTASAIDQSPRIFREILVIFTEKRG